MIPAVSGAWRPRWRRSAAPPGHRRKTCYRGGSRHGACPGGRPSSELSSETVQNIGQGNVASVRASPYRRRVIGPCAAPASSVGGLAGSPKCFRACRLSLRRPCRQLTLCKDSIAASAARSACILYLTLRRTAYRCVDRHVDRVVTGRARRRKIGPGTAHTTYNHHSCAVAHRAELILAHTGRTGLLAERLESRRGRKGLTYK